MDTGDVHVDAPEIIMQIDAPARQRHAYTER